MERVEKFLKEFLEKTQKDAKYSIEKTSSGLKVNINNEIHASKVIEPSFSLIFIN